MDAEVKSSNTELIDQFILNERKSRWWTIISVVIFCILAAIIISDKAELQKKNADINRDQAELKKKNDELNALSEQLKIANKKLEDTVEVVAKNLNNSLADKYIDSLNAKNFETQVKQFVKEIDPGTQVQTTDPANWKVDTARIKKKIKQADAFLKIENLLKPQEPTVKVNAADLLVFIHYMPEFKLQAFRVAAELKSQYNVQPTQAILNFTFNSEVKYFADADAANAGAISSTLNKLLAGSPGLTFPVQEYKQKTPFRQIEIWIGKYKPIDTKMIYQQAKINTKLIKQN